MYLADQLTSHTPSEIGRAFGQRDRTSVNYALKQVGASVHEDQVVRNTVNNLRRRLAQPS
jgi:chromosomal replication initiation ATPase DnaA